METTLEKKPLNKLLISAIIIIFLIAAGCAWYFLYYTKTPTYSLNIIKTSVQTHDVATFKKHVDLDALLSRAYDDLMDSSLAADPQLKNNPFAFGFIKMFKPIFTSSFKDDITRFVETGNWEETKPANSQGPNMNAMENKTGLKASTFKGVEYTKKDGKIALVGIRIFDQDLKRDFVIDLQMRELDDGTWQAAGFSNLKEYFAATNKVK